MDKKFYQDSSDTSKYWLQSGDALTSFYKGDLRPVFTGSKIALMDKRSRHAELANIEITELGNDADSDESYWSDLATFKEETVDFFANASDDGGIKQKLITGNTGDVGTITSYATNLSKGNIISFTAQVSDSDGTWILPNHGVDGTDTVYYYATIKSDGLLYIYIPSTSSAVYGCAFSCLITYTE